MAEALTEKAESVVGEVFNVVGQWQSEQQKQVQEFQVLHTSSWNRKVLEWNCEI